MAAVTVTKKEKEPTSRKPVKKTTKKADAKKDGADVEVEVEVKEPKKTTKKKAVSAETVADTGDEAEEPEVDSPAKKTTKTAKTTKAKATPKKASTKKTTTSKKPAAKKAATKPRAKKTIKADLLVTDDEHDEHEEEDHSGAEDDDEGLEPVDVKVKMRRPRKIKGCESYTDEQGRVLPARKIAFSNMYLAYVVPRKEAVDMEKAKPLIVTDWDGRKAAKAATKQHLLDNNLMTGKRDVYLLEIFDHLSTGNKKRIATHAYSVRYTMQHKTKTIVNKKATFNRDVAANPKRIPLENMLSFHKQCMTASHEYDPSLVEEYEIKNRATVDITEDSGDEEEITVEDFQKIVGERDTAAKAEKEESPEAER